MRRLLLGGIVATALLLGACSDDDSGDDAADGSSPTQEDGAPTTFAGETRLALGEEAEIDDETASGEPVTYTISVDSIEPSTVEALTAEGIEVDDPTQTPYYVRYTVTKTSEGTTTSFTGTGFTGITADDTPSGPLTIIGEFAPCQTTPLDDLPVGTAQEQCSIFLVDEGGELIGVRKNPASGSVSWVVGGTGG